MKASEVMVWQFFHAQAIEHVGKLSNCPVILSASAKPFGAHTENFIANVLPEFVISVRIRRGSIRQSFCSRHREQCV
jgi:hypothetical protein